MRTRRKQMAEEKAAKTAVQLLFPLILFTSRGSSWSSWTGCHQHHGNVVED